MIVGEKQQQPQKRALGRGLSALIPQAVTQPTPSNVESLPDSARGVLKLPIESVARDSDQPRKLFDEAKLGELSESIRLQGVLQPILVRKEGNTYKLIAGERRWRAAQLAGLQEIPALVKDVSESEAFELALIENLQRTDLNPIEEALGFKRLIEEFGLTQEQVSHRVSKDRSSVANALRLLALPEDVKVLLSDGAISMGHARALLGLSSAVQMQELARKVSLQRLSVRETERLVHASRNPVAIPGRPGTSQPPQTRQVVEEIQRLLGTKVRLKDRGGKGTLEVDFSSYEDLERLMALFRK